MTNNKVHITGDLHGEIERLTSYQKTKPGDIVIVAGDFGVIWRDSTEQNLDLLEKDAEEKNIIYLFIDGNHENFSRLNQYPETNIFGAKAGAIRPRIYHLKRGNIYTILGHTYFCFGGAVSIDKGYRKPFISWWPEEECNSAERRNALKNLEKIDFKPEFIITHTAPKIILALIKELQPIYDIQDKTQDFLADLYLKIMQENPDLKMWFFGHFHLDKSSPKNKFTCLYKKFKTII